MDPEARKFRDAPERERIRGEVLDKLQQLGLAARPAVAPLLAALDEFVARAGSRKDRGAARAGRVELPEEDVGPGRAIEYMLPGRRVLRHFVRVTAAAAARQE
jgi:hypothetical protein